MPESKTNRPDTTTTATSREGGQDLARRDRERTGLHRPGSWSSDPFDFFDRMAEEMDRTFDRMFRDFGMPRRSWLSRSPFRLTERQALWSPRVEAFQKGDRFIVRADLPGLKKDDIQVEVTGDAVTIRGERLGEHEENREGYFHSEREYGQFYRTIPLPEGVIADNAQASFNNGVLEISMPAAPAEATRGRRIEIKQESESPEKK
jgi:HSP20 family protein